MLATEASPSLKRPEIIPLRSDTEPLKEVGLSAWEEALEPECEELMLLFVEDEKSVIVPPIYVMFAEFAILSKGNMDKAPNRCQKRLR